MRGSEPAHEVMPRAHKVAALLKRWLLELSTAASSTNISTTTSTNSPSASIGVDHRPVASCFTASSSRRWPSDRPPTLHHQSRHFRQSRRIGGMKGIPTLWDISTVGARRLVHRSGWLAALLGCGAQHCHLIPGGAGALTDLLQNCQDVAGDQLALEWHQPACGIPDLVERLVVDKDPRARDRSATVTLLCPTNGCWIVGAGIWSQDFTPSVLIRGAEVQSRILRSAPTRSDRSADGCRDVDVAHPVDSGGKLDGTRSTAFRYLGQRSVEQVSNRHQLLPEVDSGGSRAGVGVVAGTGPALCGSDIGLGSLHIR